MATTVSEPRSVPQARAPGPARRWRAFLEDALVPPFVALLIAVVIGDLLILSFGQSPGAVYAQLLHGTWGNAYGFGQVLFKATTLTFTGLAVAIGLRAGLFNIGAESQIAAGGFAAAAVALALGDAPSIVGIPLAMVGAALAGGAVGAVPGALKARFGAHEVIVTIMLNFIVLALLNWVVSAHMAVPETLHTTPIRTGTIPRLSDFVGALHGSAANLTILVAIATAVWYQWYLFRTRGGYELRATGLQPGAAEYGGVSVGRVWLKAMVLSGAVAGLGGINAVLGYKGYYEEGMTIGSGFIGIAVALVGRNSAVGVVLAALLFATLSQGGLAINAMVPKQMVEVLEAVVIIAVMAAVPEVRRILRLSRRAEEAA
jgi:simple sugar transport system permease protein